VNIVSINSPFLVTYIYIKIIALLEYREKENEILKHKTKIKKKSETNSACQKLKISKLD